MAESGIREGVQDLFLGEFQLSVEAQWQNADVGTPAAAPKLYARHRARGKKTPHIFPQRHSQPLVNHIPRHTLKH